MQVSLTPRISRVRFYAWLAMSVLAVFWPGYQVAAEDEEISATAIVEISAGAMPMGGAKPPQPSQLLWGDLHVHSNLSFDAFAFGNETVSSESAFAFARGEAITTASGLTAQLDRPLDFLLVSDHAEFLGVMRGLTEKDPSLLEAKFAARWLGWLEDEQLPKLLDEFVASIAGEGSPDLIVPEQFAFSVWEHINDVAEAFNEPGTFTAFIGYEWTAMDAGRNLHRNVIFRDGGATVRQFVPFSSTGTSDPEALWNHLEAWTTRTGGEVMAIPHNGNLSDGLMFAEERMNGEPIDGDYVSRRLRWEPVVEMTQVKGDAEAHPLLSPEDPFADFENWDKTNIGGTPKDASKLVDMYSHEYVRPVLQVGLQLQERIGGNPFKFGMIGSTDAHTGMATADSDNYQGKFPDSEASALRLSNKMGGVLWANRDLTASGYAAVWAPANTREAIFDALARKEVYASTGPRIAVRFFGGWALDEAIINRADMIETAYQNGVPMGGDLPPRTADAPKFILSAQADPEGAALDRVQIVKGWIDQTGARREKIYDVAWSLGRMRDPVTHALPPVASTVDVSAATYDNSQGAQQLTGWWQDPEFDAQEAAVYYARVIEIPTPRWTTYDAARFGVALPSDIPATIQERAYTSPIWYTPERLQMEAR